MDYRFQVSLRGIIDLLSQHLYSSPQVFVRELLQNGVDAITARQSVEPGFHGRIDIELVLEPGAPPALIFSDNGIGLTEEEIHRFLTTIGESSKRDALAMLRGDYIGQFGIGLLSCFMVCDEVVFVTRSLSSPSALLWRGRQDGTYQLEPSTEEIEPGTRVIIHCKKGSEDWFKPDRLRELAELYGSLLPVPITLKAPGGARRINDTPVPWREAYSSDGERREASLAYGRAEFDLQFLDAIPLSSKVGQVEGVAYVLPFSPSPVAKQQHRVYVKGMFLSDRADNILPDWAFFVRCILNADALRPTASRESFYEDDALRHAQAALGGLLRGHIIRMRHDDPDRLRRIILLHYASFKALAVHDDEFYRLIIDWLPFETTNGFLTLEECRRFDPLIRYVHRTEIFRQVAPILSAQNLCVIDAGYQYDAELLEKLPSLFPDRKILRLDVSSVTASLSDLEEAEALPAKRFLDRADGVLAGLLCTAAVKKFRPRDVPAIYLGSADDDFLRGVGKAKQVSNPLWAGILDGIAKRPTRGFARLCFNYDNPLVSQIMLITDEHLFGLSVEAIYSLALLMSQRPMTDKEFAAMNQSFLGLIEWGARRGREAGHGG